jgi:hypothetical protein
VVRNLMVGPHESASSNELEAANTAAELNADRPFMLMACIADGSDI